MSLVDKIRYFGITVTILKCLTQRAVAHSFDSLVAMKSFHEYLEGFQNVQFSVIQLKQFSTFSQFSID